jgi:uncharacterized protein
MSTPEADYNDRKTAVADLCRQFQVSILYVFGSRALEVWQWLNGERLTLDPANSSDVDMGVKTAVNVHLSVRQKVILAQALEALLNVTRVDLVVMHEIGSFLAVNVIRGERLFADNAYLADEYELYIMRRAGDLAHWERERQDLVLKTKQAGS